MSFIENTLDNSVIWGNLIAHNEECCVGVVLFQHIEQLLCFSRYWPIVKSESYYRLLCVNVVEHALCQEKVVPMVGGTQLYRNRGKQS